MKWSGHTARTTPPTHITLTKHKKRALRTARKTCEQPEQKTQIWHSPQSLQSWRFDVGLRKLVSMAWARARFWNEAGYQKGQEHGSGMKHGVKLLFSNEERTQHAHSARQKKCSAFQHIPHSTQQTAHSTQPTAHSTQHTTTTCSIQHTTHITHCTTHSPPHTAHSPPHAAHSTQHIAHHIH